MNDFEKDHIEHLNLFDGANGSILLNVLSKEMNLTFKIIIN